MAVRVPTELTPYTFTRRITANMPITLTIAGGAFPPDPIDAAPRWVAKLNDYPKPTEFYGLFGQFRIVKATARLRLAEVRPVDLDGGTILMNAMPDTTFPPMLLALYATRTLVGTDERYDWDDMLEKRVKQFQFSKLGDEVKIDIPTWVNQDITGVLGTAEGSMIHSPWLDCDAGGATINHGLTYSAFKALSSPFPVAQISQGSTRGAEQVIYRFEVDREITIQCRGVM